MYMSIIIILFKCSDVAVSLAGNQAKMHMQVVQSRYFSTCMKCVQPIAQAQKKEKLQVQ